MAATDVVCPIDWLGVLVTSSSMAVSVGSAVVEAMADELVLRVRRVLGAKELAPPRTARMAMTLVHAGEIFIVAYQLCWLIQFMIRFVFAIIMRR